MIDPSCLIPAIKDASQIVRRANPNAIVDEDELRREVVDLLAAVGTFHSTEDSKDFAAVDAEEPSDADLVQQFRTIADSDDPLNPQICFGIALAKITAAAHRRWTSRRYRRLINRPHLLRGVTSDFLTMAELADIQEFANQLAHYHRTQIRRKRPSKDDQDTLLDGLADLFVSYTESQGHRYELPHSVRSHFIQFCHAVLRPFFGLTEVSPKALSNRWNNLRKQHRLSLPETIDSSVSANSDEY